MAWSSSKLILAGKLADGLGGESKADQAVLVTGDRITAVGPRETIQQQTPPGAERIDLSSACVTPGLIDGHTHLSLAGDGRNYIEMFTESDEMMVLTGGDESTAAFGCWDYHDSRTWRAEPGGIRAQGGGWARIYSGTASACEWATYHLYRRAFSHVQ